jgi:hypothetical protein
MRGRGNVNLRGKKVKMLRCGCCEAWDGRDKCRRLESERDMRKPEDDYHDVLIDNWWCDDALRD